MRRLILGMALVVGSGAGTASEAGALDAGVVTVSSSFSGNDSCLEPPGTFAVDLELTGTIAAAGQTFVGTAKAHADGTYVQGPCSPGDAFGVLQAFLDHGTVAGQGPGGSVAGTCAGSMSMGPLVGLLPVDVNARASMSLACAVSVNGGATAAVQIDAHLVGSRDATTASHAGVYTADPV